MHKQGLKSNQNDYNRYDRRTDCSCVSISYPNVELLRSYKRKFTGSHWAMIVLDPKVLYENPCFFAEHNAATHTIASDLSSRTDTAAFENMFQRFLHIQLSSGSKSFNRLKLENYTEFPTSPQAEVLVKGRIDSDLIKSIIFENTEDACSYKDLLETKNIEYRINSNLFNESREDWIMHKEIERILEPWLKNCAS